MTCKLIISVILVAIPAAAQTVHQLPFASQGNTIELVVANGSTTEATDVTVNVERVPTWLQFAKKEQTIGSLSAGEEQCVVFVFAVDKSAPVGQEHGLSFVVSNTQGERWTKGIRLVVAAPETFELFQNYPNPFNPTTTISFQLPVDSHVRLKIFNLLGQEVARLVEGEQAAGYHQVVWDASVQPSGMYVYEMRGTDAADRRTLARKAMLLIK